MQTLTRLLTLAAVSVTAAVSSHAGTFANINVTDGSAADWAGIADIFTDGAGDGNPIDIASVKVANDDTWLYVYVSFHTAVNPNAGPSLVLSIDTDNSLSTGFDIYGLGAVGADVSYANDFPFQSGNDPETDAPIYNTGVQGVAATGTLNTFDAGAGIGQYNTVTTFQEYRLSIASTYTNSEGTFSVFPNDTIRIMFWSDGGIAADATVGGTYTFASVPEPASAAALAGLGILGLVALRRRR